MFGWLSDCTYRCAHRAGDTAWLVTGGSRLGWHSGGGLIRLINGLAITRLRVVPFIATLGMLGIARGVAKWLADQQTVNVPATWVNELAVTVASPSWLLLAPGVWLSMLLAILVAVILRRTVFGRRVFALGSNEAAARACGIPVDKLKVLIYAVAGLFFWVGRSNADVSPAPG